MVLISSLCGCSQKVSDVNIEGGMDTASKATESYYTAMSNQDFDTLISVSASLNKTCVQNTVAGFDEAEHAKGLDAMKTEMAADPDKATLTPTVTENKTYEENDEEFKTFLATNSAILSRTKQIKAYSVATVSLNISVPGETETFTATETITCVKVDTSWFVMVTE